MKSERPETRSLIHTTLLPDSPDRGQSGIGTLIVFIAMVLVATIAAGVLIETASFLQEKSELTSQQSSAQVTDRIQIVSSYGEGINEYEVETETNTIGPNVHKYVEGDAAAEAGDWIGVSKVKFIVRKSASADSIRLDKVTINYLGPNGAEQIELTDADVTIEVIDGAGNNVLSDSSDRALIVISLNPIAQDTDGDGTVDAFPNDFQPLAPGTEATFELTTESGATTRKTVTIPPILSTSDEVVEL